MTSKPAGDGNVRGRGRLNSEKAEVIRHSAPSDSASGRSATRGPASAIAGRLTRGGIALVWRPRFDAGIVAAHAGARCAERPDESASVNVWGPTDGSPERRRTQGKIENRRVAWTSEYESSSSGKWG